MKHALLSLALAACTGDPGAPAEGDTTVTGPTRWRDAETTPDGGPAEAGRPESQDGMRVYVTVEGDGTLSGLEPECELEGATGSFVGVLEGDAQIDDDGTYVAVLASEQGTFTTPTGGCEIPELEIATVTSVGVRGELETTQQNCESYCEAHARAEAESACGSDASCRAEVEAEEAATCETTCTGSTTYTLVAETALDATAVAELNASGLTGTGLGTLEVDLTFDRVEDEDGAPVE